jgi:hypothetical protein
MLEKEPMKKELFAQKASKHFATMDIATALVHERLGKRGVTE